MQQQQNSMTMASDHATCDTASSAVTVAASAPSISSGGNKTINNKNTTTNTTTNTNTNNDDDGHPVDSDERIRRRLLNKHLKQRNRLRKYETRMQQAVFRNDVALEESARRDWEDHMQRLRDDPNSVLNYRAPPLELLEPTTATNGTTGNLQGHNSKCCQLNQGSRFRHLHPSLRSMEERDTQRVREGSAWVLKFRQKLVPRILASHSLRENENQTADKSNDKSIVKGNDKGNNTETTTQKTAATSLTTKQRQTIHAAELKANMQQGTQTKSMFNDELAVLGYTRQKFHERAVLAFSSLDRLDPMYCDDTGNDEDIPHNDNGDSNDTDTKTTTTAGQISEKRRKNHETNQAMLRCIWERLMTTEQIVSIGCGPGCDAVGVLGFLESHGVKPSNGIVLLDFVMNVWKELVLDTLIPMIVPRCVPSVRTVMCDVRESLLVPTGGDDNENENSSTNRTAFLELTEPTTRRHKLVVVSYLLTETRQKWKSFFGHLLGLLKGTESLLLLTEPTAWQLHEFLRCFGGGGSSDNENDNSGEDDLLLKAHLWLDSSRDLPHLQDLDKRNGPAILLVCTT